jgi:hypothetical protein
MKTPIEIIQSYGIPTHSHIKAIQFINDTAVDLRKEQYESVIQEIIGSNKPPHYSNDKEAKVYYKYTIQETIRAFKQQDVPDMENVWITVITNAQTFIFNNPWSIKEYVEENIDSEGNTKPKRESKKVQAENLYQQMDNGINDRQTIIAALIEQVGLTKTGAPTYFHNLKKQFGYKGPETTRGGSPLMKRNGGKSKSKIAKEIYIKMKGQPRKDIITAITNEAETSPAGANTYYCKAKKEVG